MPKRKKPKTAKRSGKSPTEMREGKTATNAFSSAMQQILHPLPKKERTN